MKTPHMFAAQWFGAQVLSTNRFIGLVAEIQRDARQGMVPVEDVKPIVDSLNEEINNNQEMVTLKGWIRIKMTLEDFRAKYPNLFTK